MRGLLLSPHSMWPTMMEMVLSAAKPENHLTLCSSVATPMAKATVEASSVTCSAEGKEEEGGRAVCCGQCRGEGLPRPWQRPRWGQQRDL